MYILYRILPENKPYYLIYLENDSDFKVYKLNNTKHNLRIIYDDCGKFIESMKLCRTFEYSDNFEIKRRVIRLHELFNM